MALDVALVLTVVIAAACKEEIQQSIAIVVDQGHAAAQRFDNGKMLGLFAVAEHKVYARLGRDVAVDVGERLALVIAHQVLPRLVGQSLNLLRRGELLTGSLRLLITTPAAGAKGAQPAQQQEDSEQP